MFAKGDAIPVVLELLVDDGEVITALAPTSSVSPDLTGDWQEFFRTYDTLPDGDVTIVLGVGRGASGAQSRFDKVTFFHSPEPLPPEMLRLAARRVDLYEDKKIDFKDFAVMADEWLDVQLFPAE